MFSTPNAKLVNRAARNQSLTRWAPDPKRLHPGLRVKTHIKAGPCPGTQD
jgi:hypothetical protein